MMVGFFNLKAAELSHVPIERAMAFERAVVKPEAPQFLPQWPPDLRNTKWYAESNLPTAPSSGIVGATTPSQERYQLGHLQGFVGEPCWPDVYESSTEGPEDDHANP